MFETALEGKTMVLGVTRSITAYKIANLASMLKKMRADVEMIMIKNATEFISPVISESLTGKKYLMETFDRDFEFSVKYVALAKRADVFPIAPTPANMTGKVSHRITDDMLTATFLTCGYHKIIASAMNTHVYENPTLRGSLKCCESCGMKMLRPAVGYLIYGDTGAEKMPEPEVLFDYIVRAVGYKKNMVGKEVLATTGPTREAIDLIRFTTNHSTGKMGYAVTKVAFLRGADVALVSGLVPVEVPRLVKVVPMESTRQIYEMMIAASGEQGIIVKATAVADYRPTQAADERMKEKDGELSMDLCHTDNTSEYLGSHKRDGQFLCRFPVETQNMLENSRARLLRKHLGMIVANSLKVDGAGSETDTNVVTIITGDGELEPEKMSKEEVTGRLLNEVMRRAAGPT